MVGRFGEEGWIANYCEVVATVGVLVTGRIAFKTRGYLSSLMSMGYLIAWRGKRGLG